MAEAIKQQLPDVNERPLLTLAEVIPFLGGVGRSAAYEAVKRGEIPSVRIGTRVFIPNAALRRFFELDAG